MAISLRVQESQNITLTPSESAPVSFDMTDKIQIVEADPYEGSYTVTPSSESQTLPTEGKTMTDDLVVEAIDPDYVGTGIPERNSLTIDGREVTAEWGYYNDDTSVNIPLANINTGIQIPSMGVTSETEFSYGIDPSTQQLSVWYSGLARSPLVLSEGYAEECDIAVVLYDQGTFNFPVMRATTITPTSSEQTAVPAGTYAYDDIKVAPIPSNYGLVTWNGSTLTIS